MQSQNEVLLFGGIRLSQDISGLHSDNDLYRLDMTTLKWSVEITDNRPPAVVLATGAVLLRSVLIVYGGVLVKDETSSIFVKARPQTETWGYYNQARTWLRYSMSDSVPPKRVLHATVAKDERTMMLYGGMVMTDDMFRLNMVIRRDLWSFTLPPLKNDTVDLSDQTFGAQWRLVDQSGPNTSYLASMVAVQNVLYVFGGSGTILTLESVFKQRSAISTLDFNCSDNLWRYNLSDTSKGWEKVQYEGLGPGQRCMHDASPYGDRMLIIGGCRNRVALRLNLASFVFEYYDCPTATSVWVYDPLTITWLELSNQPVYQSGITGSATFVWNELILSFCGTPSGPREFSQIPSGWVAFSVYKPGRPPGTTSIDLRTHMCSECPKGFYSETPRSNCSACPHGLTTLKARSTAQVQCNQCISGYCQHGSCTVTSQLLTPNCACKDGFTRDDSGLCTIPTYYYIGASATVAGIALIVMVIVLVAKFVSFRKRHDVMLRNKEHELMELTTTWNIDSREVRLRRRIDRDSPGGYGEVYQAEYREMTVAVKKLQGVHQDLHRIELEFEREIEVMRTIRHPNIVLFLGGGRYHDDGCPFLVVEYMPRGSLATILKNKEIHLEESLKIRFAVDAAKGMRFLHSLRPPRIHRDLKSGNLLVSHRWVVKVADFGAARLVRHEGVDQEAVRGGGPLDTTAPLLHADYQLSSGVGTPCWCAPEILCGEGYGTPADVYRYSSVKIPITDV